MINNDMIAFDTYHSVWIGSVAICFDSRKRMCIFFEKILKMFFFFLYLELSIKQAQAFVKLFQNPPIQVPPFVSSYFSKGDL